MSTAVAETLETGLIDDTDSGAEIPVLDVSDYLADVPGAREKLAPVLHQALTEVGFFYLVGHDVPIELIDTVFQESERFHALPLTRKKEIKLNDVFVGYIG
jgi:isopenicillin N synthase-like dioxygenase